jgi:uncharacterized membrane protein YcaP (DUF421 family)
MCHETMLHLCVPVGEKVIRTIAVYGFLIVGLRLAGKRELAQFTAFDLVVLLTISNAVQNAIIGPDNTLTGGLIGAGALLIANDLVGRAVYLVPKLDVVLEGRETVLYENGKVNHRALRREVVTENELMSAVRRQGARSLKEVEKVAIEPNGNVLVLIKEEIALHTILKELRDLRRQLGQEDEVR